MYSQIYHHSKGKKKCYYTIPSGSLKPPIRLSPAVESAEPVGQNNSNFRVTQQAELSSRGNSLALKIFNFLLEKENSNLPEPQSTL